MPNSYKPALLRLAKGAVALALVLGVSHALVKAVVKGESMFREHMERRERAYETMFHDNLDRIVNEARRTESDKWVELLRAIENAEGVDDARRLKLSLVLGELYVWKMRREKSPAKRLEYAFAAEKYFRYAIDKVDDLKRKDIGRKLAVILMDQGKWGEAATIFAASENYKSEPAERWDNWILWAECLAKSGKNLDALERLTKVVDECDIRALKAKALRRKADILLQSSMSPAGMAALAGKAKPDDPAAYSAALRSEAFALYQQVGRLLPALNPDVAASQLGMLDILIARGDKDAAYNLANDIQTGSAPSDDKATSLVVIAHMEERGGNVAKAIEVLTICKARYPDYQGSDDVTYNLYKLLLRDGEWLSAFDLGKELIVQYHREKVTAEILKDFYPGPNRLAAHLDFKRPEATGPAFSQRRDYLAESIDMFDSIKQSPGQWRRLGPTVEAVKAMLHFYAGDYAAAEQGFAPLFDQTALIWDPESVLRLDLDCAIRLKASPAVIAYRAKRHLDAYPEGTPYTQSTFQIMLNAYFEMGLYEDTLRLAKNLYLEQLGALAKAAPGKAKPTYDNEDWFLTIAKIGQCYERLGAVDKANAIIRNYSSQFLGKDFTPQIYYDWAGVAAFAGQEMEAVRRCDVALSNNPPPALRLKLLLARAMLSMGLGNETSFRTGRPLLQELAASELLGAAEKAELERGMYEAMLGYALGRDPDSFETLLQEVMAKFRDETWPEYWVLRYFTPMFAAKSLTEIGAKHKQMLDNDFLKAGKSSSTFGFLRRQLDLIQEQLKIEDTVNKLKAKGL